MFREDKYEQLGEKKERLTEKSCSKPSEKGIKA